MLSEHDDSFSPDDFSAHVACVYEHCFREETPAEVVWFAVEHVAFIDSRDVEPLVSFEFHLVLYCSHDLILRVSQIQPILIQAHLVSDRVVPVALGTFPLNESSHSAEQVIDIC